jgi:hypothetical protein
VNRECSTHGDEKCYNILKGKSEGKTSFRRPRRLWEDIIKMHLKEIGLRVRVNYLSGSWDRRNLPLGSVKVETFLNHLSDW